MPWRRCWAAPCASLRSWGPRCPMWRTCSPAFLLRLRLAWWMRRTSRRGASTRAVPSLPWSWLALTRRCAQMRAFCSRSRRCWRTWRAVSRAHRSLPRLRRDAISRWTLSSRGLRRTCVRCWGACPAWARVCPTWGASTCSAWGSGACMWTPPRRWRPIRRRGRSCVSRSATRARMRRSALTSWPTRG